LFEAAVGSQLGQSHQIGNGIVIREMGDELQAQRAVEDRHKRAISYFRYLSQIHFFPLRLIQDKFPTARSSSAHARWTERKFGLR
jgi:hypothetical protein